jgi:hypothetical protein
MVDVRYDRNIAQVHERVLISRGKGDPRLRSQMANG